MNYILMFISIKYYALCFNNFIKISWLIIISFFT